MFAAHKRTNNASGYDSFQNRVNVILSSEGEREVIVHHEFGGGFVCGPGPLIRVGSVQVVL